MPAPVETLKILRLLPRLIGLSLCLAYGVYSQAQFASMPAPQNQLSIERADERPEKDLPLAEQEPPGHPLLRALKKRTDAPDSAPADTLNIALPGADSLPALEDDPLPEAPVIQEITVSGAANVDDEKKARRVIQTQVGEPVNPRRQREDIRRLYETGLFKPSIMVDAIDVEDGVRLNYIVDPNPTVAAVTFRGNEKFTAKRLQSKLPVKAGQVYSTAAQVKLRDTLRRYYTERGYNDVDIVVEERPAAGNQITLEIAVDEGTRIKIKDLILRGNDSVRDLALQLRVENRGSFAIVQNYFNESRFQRDIEAIKAYYLRRGHLDVEVRRGEFIYAPDKSWVSPVIEITEGPRYKIGRLEARGYTVFTREEVLSPYRGLQGEFFNMTDFARRSEQVKNMYGDEGFLMADVEPDFHKDPNRGMVDVHVAVSEGARIYVGDVQVLSSSYPDDSETGWMRKFYSRFTPPVRDHVVQREVRLQPGQVYRRFEEVKTRERLKALNVFETVQVRDQLSGQSNVRDMVVDVKQGDTGNLVFGVGFGDVEGAFIYANYTERNLFGEARDLRVGGTLGTNAWGANISYLDRYFMGRDLAAKFDLFHSSMRRQQELRQISTGGTAEFMRPLDDCFKDSIRFRLENVAFDIDGKEERKLRDPIDDYVAATVRYRISRDTRDDTFFPREGSVMAGSVETGVANAFLLKLEGQYSTYMSITDDVVFALNATAGLIPAADIDDVGYADRLFLGGTNDMRGFRLYGAGPVDPGNEDIFIGGATKLLTQFELRRQFTDNFAGLLFTDVGMLGRDPFEFDKPRVSAGAGLRFRLPIATVGVDLGVPVVKEDTDRTQYIHFELSSAF